MLKKTITYEDFDGETVTEEHFFHLSKADLVELEMSEPGGLETKINRIIKSEDGAALIAEFKKLLLMSYGQKSEDGKRFIRSAQLQEEFLQSEAYSALFMELVTDADKAAEFVNGIVPNSLERDLQKMQEKKVIFPPPNPDDTFEGPASVMAARGPRVLTREEMIEMGHEELTHLLATGQAIIGQNNA